MFCEGLVVYNALYGIWRLSPSPIVKLVYAFLTMVISRALEMKVDRSLDYLSVMDRGHPQISPYM